MIIVNLIGGLGNQMFQYACGRAVAEHTGQKLKLDITGFKDYKLRKYSLDCFNISAEFATEKEIKLYKEGRLWFINYFSKKILKRELIKNKRFIKEKHFHFDPTILNLKGNCYLFGYWQSEKYFIDIKDIILKEFTLKRPLSQSAKEYENIILSSQSVSIHVRRGDYVNNPITNSYHGVCDISYYEKAVDIIYKKVENPKFFIFSDDLSWVKENFKFLKNSLFVELKNAPDYEEMFLMSRCKHNIIANSSFSWWGAWLNQNPNKIVIAPKEWFKDNSINTNDLIPLSWIRI